MRNSGLNRLAEALLAFQFCERDEHGDPSENARLGAFFMAQQQIMWRSYMKGGDK